MSPGVFRDKGKRGNLVKEFRPRFPYMLDTPCSEGT
jgi:hypothetical protein